PKFPWVVPNQRARSHVLLSRLPLRIATALDLHVLGLPPAFALSQDQTLKLDENFSRLVTTFDEVPPTSSARLLARITGVDLKRVPPKSRPAAVCLGFPRASRRPTRTPPSTFLFLPIHLSNSPGREALFPRSRENRRSSLLPTEIGRRVRV